MLKTIGRSGFNVLLMAITLSLVGQQQLLAQAGVISTGPDSPAIPPSADTDIIDVGVLGDGNATVRLTSLAGGHEVESDLNGFFLIRDLSNAQNPLAIAPGSANESVFIDTNHRVGFGFFPSDSDGLAESYIDVQATSGDARVIVDCQAGGFSEFMMQQGNVNQWSFGNFGDRYYIFDYQGGNKERLTIRNGGNIGLGNNNPMFDLHIGKGAGSSGINAGSTTFTIGSSRTVKENLAAMKSDDILKKISDIEVYTYDYIDGPKDKLGLMAEDFHTVFQRGSDKTINGQDVQMALWLAVQELETKALAQEKRAIEQERLLAAQGKRIQELELQVAQQKALAQQQRIKQLESLLAAKQAN